MNRQHSPQGARAQSLWTGVRGEYCCQATGVHKHRASFAHLKVFSWGITNTQENEARRSILSEFNSWPVVSLIFSRPAFIFNHEIDYKDLICNQKENISPEIENLI